MEHSYFKDRISAYFDNELKDEQRHLIAEHLKECDECRQLLEDLKKFDNLVEKHSGLGESEYWESAAQKIEHTISQKPAAGKVVDIRRPAWRGLSWKLVGVAASFAILAFIALYERDITDEVQPTREPIPKSIQKPSDIDSSALASKKQPSAEVALADFAAPVADSFPDEDAFEEIPAVTDADTKIIRVGTPKGAPVQVVTTAPESKAEVDEEAKKAPRDRAIELDKLNVTDVADVTPEAMTPPSPQIAQSPTGDALELEKADLMAQLGASEGQPLEYWRSRRDSLSELVDRSVSIEDSEGYFRSVAESPQEPIQPEKRKVTTVADKEWPVETEKLLLECQYQVALLTDDEDERDQAINFLKSYLSDEDLSLRQAAVDFLAKLPQKE